MELLFHVTPRMPTIIRVEFKKDRNAMLVTVIMSDGESTKLFSYFPDELSFEKHELMGLTKEEAQDLYAERNSKFLQTGYTS